MENQDVFSKGSAYIAHTYNRFPVAVHTVVDGDIPYIALGKETLGVVAHFQIVPPHAGHILDDNRFDLSCFGQPDHLIPTGPVE